MTLAEIQAEINGLPISLAPSGLLRAPDTPAPLAILSKQGRLLVRLAASADTLEGRMRDLTQQVAAGINNNEAEHERTLRRQADARARQFTLELVRQMDTLDWVCESLSARNDPLALEVAAVQRDNARRLAVLGVTEIPCVGLLDGRLHEGIDTVPNGGVPCYHIVSVVRRGWQCGPDILRRANVVTAAAASE